MRFFNFSSIIVGFMICLFMPEAASARSNYRRSPVIVTVNGHEITEEQVDRALERDLRLAMSLGKPPTYAVRHNMTLSVIDNLIEKFVIGERIRAKGIKVTIDEVNKEIIRIARINNMSVQSFYNKTYSTKGFTPTDIKDQVAMSLRFDKLIEMEAGSKRFYVSDREAKRYYDRNTKQFTEPKRVKASHILIKYPKTGKTSKRDVKYALGKISNMAKSGIDFAKLAVKYSQDKETRKKGGNLGFFTYDIMPKKIADAAFMLRVGEISEVIEMPYGCHLLKVFEIDPGGLIGFDKVKKEIIGWIKDDLKAEYSTKYIKQHMANAKIVWAGGKRPEPIPIKETESY